MAFSDPMGEGSTFSNPTFENEIPLNTILCLAGFCGVGFLDPHWLILVFRFPHFTTSFLASELAPILAAWCYVAVIGCGVVACVGAYAVFATHVQLLRHGN